MGEPIQGISVAISSDGNTAIVGGAGDNDQTGAAWVWTRTGATWTQQGSKLVGAGATSHAQQGYAVAISGDGNTVMIGGPSEDSGGSVWVFTRNAGVWAQQGPKLLGPGQVEWYRFGASVSLSRDGNSAIIGSPGSTGSGWVWTRVGNSWSQRQQLFGTGSVGFPQQGAAVAMASDGNTAIVGGLNDNSGIGAAWIWARSGTQWLQQGPKLVPSDGVAPKSGTSVAISADGSFALVGGQSDEAGNGAIWLWRKIGEAWFQQGPKLYGSGGPALHNQGFSVSLSDSGIAGIVGSDAEMVWIFGANSELFPTISASGYVSNIGCENGAYFYGWRTYRGYYPDRTVKIAEGTSEAPCSIKATMEGGYNNSSASTPDGDYWVEITWSGAAFAPDWSPSAKISFWRAKRVGGKWSGVGDSAGGECTPVSTGLVAWWKGESDTKDSQNGNIGIPNSIKFASGKVGNGFQLNGFNAYLKASDGNSLHTPSGFTAQLWIKPSEVRNYHYLFAKAGDGNKNWTLYLWKGGLHVELIDAGSNRAFAASTPDDVISANIFSHVAITFDTSTQRAQFYVNGVPVTTTVEVGSPFVSSIFMTPAPLYVGAVVANAGGPPFSFFQGIMDEIAIYSRALTSLEVEEIYRAGSAGICTPQNDGNWVKREVGASPSPRSGQAMTYDAIRKEVVIFGGQAGGFDARALSDTWVWTGDNWTQKSAVTSPSPRQFATLTFDSDQRGAVLFGGTDGRSLFNDTWLWNGASWTLQALAGSPPSRYSHAMAYDSARKELVLFGGIDGSGHSTNDIWVWNGNSWVQRLPAHLPPARYGSAMIYDARRGEVLLFGGNGGAGVGYRADMWAWDGIDWKEKNSTHKPPPVAGHAMAYDTVRSETILFGGDIGSNEWSNDTSVWDGVDWLKRNPDNRPALRVSHALAYDGARRDVILFGGETCVCNSTWAYTAPIASLAPTFGSVRAWGRVIVPDVRPGDKFTAVAAGGHTLGLKNDGSVVAWGENGAGQSVVPFAAQADVIAVSAAMEGSLALKKDGSVIAWGDNSRGQANVPALAQHDVIKIAAGFQHNVVLKKDHAVFAWGRNDEGQTAIPPGAQSGVIAIAAGSIHTVALRDNGAVVAWGDNSQGQLNAPLEAQTGVIAVAAGHRHMLVLKSDGSVLAWGWNFSGQTSVPDSAKSGVVAIAAGGSSSAALKSDGTVVVWGALGSGDVPPEGRSGIIAIAISGQLALLRSDGSIIVGGQDVESQQTTGALSIVSGANQTVALKNDGSVVVWGRNSEGQTTVPISAQSRVVAISAGAYHTVALKSDGTVVSWGKNESGQTSIPKDIQGRAIKIAAGASHTAVIIGTLTYSPPTITHVIASQRPGTSLVDIYYDLSGTSSGYNLDAVVSLDGGNTYNTAASHLTGDGIGATTSPGLRRHIVWDAAADLPGAFSTAVRVKLSSGVTFALSPLFALDTRTVARSALTGKVVANGSPVGGAHVRVGDLPYYVNSSVDGSFILPNVPYGRGYVVLISASGFAPKRLLNVNVGTDSIDLGTVTLMPNGGRRVVPLTPDVNPVISEVEEGGTAYRYYRIISDPGNVPLGGTSLAARVRNGAAIEQSSEIVSSWPGKQAGVSDDSGIVRISVPATAIGKAGSVARIEVLDSSAVAQTFDIRIRSFKHEKIWGHSLDGSLGGEIGTVHVEPGGRLETKITENYIGETVNKQIIERTRSLVEKGGVETTVGSFKVGGLKNKVGAGAGAQLILEWSGQWQFDPNETDGILNLQKVYYAFGDIICGGPLGSEFYNKFTDFWYGKGLQDALLIGSSGHAHLGGYFDAEAHFGIGTFGPVALRGGSDLNGAIEGSVGYDRTYDQGRIISHTLKAGYQQELHSGIQAIATLGNLNHRGFKFSINAGERNSMSARIESNWKTGAIESAGLEFENEFTKEGGLDLLGWNDVVTPLAANESITTTHTYELAFDNGSSFEEVASASPFWASMLRRNNSFPFVTVAGLTEAAIALDSASDNSGKWMTYEKKVQRKYSTNADFPVEASELGEGFKLDFSATIENGASMVVERGVAHDEQLFPLEHQIDQTLSLIPTQPIFMKELDWLLKAEAPDIAGVRNIKQYITSTNPNLSIAQRFSLFFHDVQGGAEIAVQSVSRAVGIARLASKKSAAGLAVETKVKPESGQSNYVYGVSGLTLINGTNEFPSLAMLRLFYNDSDVTGLDEQTLGVYRFAGGTNRWQLVAGSMVNSESNYISAEIQDFGTYAIAPPMPAGAIQFFPPDSTLNADGTNEWTLIATNLLLNTGAAAIQSWLYTVSAEGIDLLDEDVSTNWPGLQIASSNGVLRVHVRAPLSGSYAIVRVDSVAGDAFGEMAINLLDASAPATPHGLVASAGQSRIMLTWNPNSESDLAGYRLYFNSEIGGPPWVGTAAIEGLGSPITVTGTNFLLKGLQSNTDYFVAISAIDSSGNESPTSDALKVRTVESPPSPPGSPSVAMDDTTLVSWNLSEDDAYNDRDVDRYLIWRILLPGGAWTKVGEVPAGISLFAEHSPSVPNGKFVRYGISAVDRQGLESNLIQANRYLAGTLSADNDGDGIPDEWERLFGLDSANPTDATGDFDHDGLTNLQEYQLGLDPLVRDQPVLEPLISGTGTFGLKITALYGRVGSLEVSTNLLSWQSLPNLVQSDTAIYFNEPVTSSTNAFYRVVIK